MTKKGKQNVQECVVTKGGISCTLVTIIAYRYVRDRVPISGSETATFPGAPHHQLH